ncbi:MAG: class I SAM-dependent methyltransferase [Acidimicrobiales bacterium]
MIRLWANLCTQSGTNDKKTAQPGRRVNIGCGATPTRGWLNYDNSLTVRLARHRVALSILHLIGLISSDQIYFARTVREQNIVFANSIRRIPLSSSSVEVLYSSHMLEHLDRDEARLFLGEVSRVLISGGILRLAIPDLSIHLDRYANDGDADEFMNRTCLYYPRSRTVLARLREMFIGRRNHVWMYDAKSLAGLLEASGFTDVESLPAGITRIPNPGSLNLRERSEESAYVEGRKP